MRVKGLVFKGLEFKFEARNLGIRFLVVGFLWFRV